MDGIKSSETEGIKMNVVIIGLSAKEASEVLKVLDSDKYESKHLSINMEYGNLGFVEFVRKGKKD